MARQKHIDVAPWLESLGLGIYVEAFRDNDIDGQALPDLTADDLRDIGVASVGHRRRILTAAATLRNVAAPVTGAASEAPPAAAERRILTVMFCDLVGSTALSAVSDPEDFREFITHFRHEIEAAILPFGGTVSQFLGDGVMASFGFPVASGHDAERAVAAGLAVIETVSRILPFEGRQPEVRVGIATGLTVVGAFDEGLSLRDDSAIGETPNLAARLQAVAEPGSLIIADQTRELIGNIFDCADLGDVRIHGITAPVRVWRVRGRSSTASRYDALRAARRSQAFVDRQAERADLALRFATMRAGKGRIIVVNGETGIGKSRLIRQALSTAGIDRPVVLQCSPYAIGVPFYAIRYYVRQAAGLIADEPAAATAVRLSEWLRSAVDPLPDLAIELLAAQLDPARPAEGVLTRLAPVELRARTMALLALILRGAVSESGALIVEDVQWIDPSTIELLNSVLPDFRDAGYLMVGTAQPGPLPDWLANDGAETLRLRRLAPADIGEMVLSLAAGVAMTAEIAEALVTRSDGVPLYAEELVRGYLDSIRQGLSANPLEQVPLSLSESLLARLDRLVHGRQIASIAAAIGREFPISVLTAVSDLPPSVVHTGIGELLAANIIVPGQSPFGEAIKFRHNLVRDAAYGLLLRRKRTILHARIADTLSKQFPDIATAAPHLVAIQRAAAGQFTEAASAWDKAGQEASRRSAYAEAVGFFRNAIELTRRAAPSPERDERELGQRLSLVAALICARGHRGSDVAEEIAHVMTLGRTLGPSARMVPTLHIKWVQMLTANLAGTARDFAYQVRETTADSPDVDRLIVLRMCATSDLFCGDLRTALKNYQSYMELLDPDRHGDQLRTGHTDHTAVVMMGIAEVHTLAGNRAEADAWRKRTVEYARTSRRLYDRCHTLTFAGCLHPYLLGEDADVEYHARELAEVMRAEPLPAWAGFSDLFLGLVATRRGAVADGLATARRGVEMLSAHRVYHNFWPLLHAEACLAAGLFDECSRMLNEARRMMEYGNVRFRSELCRLEARLLADRDGDREGALRLLTEASEIAEAQGAGLFTGRIVADRDRLTSAKVFRARSY